MQLKVLFLGEIAVVQGEAIVVQRGQLVVSHAQLPGLREAFGSGGRELLAAVLLEGWQPIVSAIARATPATWGAVLWQSLGNSLFGYAAWGWLLARHPAATITPLAMLVPVFGMGASALLLGEALPAWKLGAGALVLCGLALNILWPLRGRVAWRRGAGA